MRWRRQGTRSEFRCFDQAVELRSISDIEFVTEDVRTGNEVRIGQSQPRALLITRSRISAADISPASNRASCSRQYADDCPPSIRVMATAFLTLSA
jgi:hypothetical protein